MAAAVGELRITISLNSDRTPSNNKGQPPKAEGAMQCWKDELLCDASHENNAHVPRGMEHKMTKDMSKIYDNSHCIVKNGADIVFAFMFFCCCISLFKVR